LLEQVVQSEAHAEGGLVPVVVDQALAVPGEELRVQPKGAENLRAGPRELSATLPLRRLPRPATLQGVSMPPVERRQVTVAEVIGDVRVVVLVLLLP